MNTTGSRVILVQKFFAPNIPSRFSLKKKVLKIFVKLIVRISSSNYLSFFFPEWIITLSIFEVKLKIKVSYNF